MPKYRADVAGNLAGIKEDCIATFRGEMNNADCFIIDMEDCENTMREYGDYLTVAELRACFKKAQK